MKKALLISSLIATVLSVNAQQRLVLYEEFSGENCGPCAALNPGLWSLLSENEAEVILIKYQSPIPSPGPIYHQNSTDVQARRSYYSVGSAPYGLIDAKRGGNIANHNQAMLDAAKAVPVDFIISLSVPTVSATGELSAEVTVTSTGTYTGTNLRLRAALVESLHYDLPPGTNGEVDFHNVMRKMYPSADGQGLENIWATNQTETYTVAGLVPDYVDKRAEVLFLLVWIQEDGGSNARSVLQAAKSDRIDIALPVDVSSEGIAIDQDLVCSPDDAVPMVTIKNTGTDPLTAATIYYKVDNGSWLEHAWTGNLVADASEEVALPTIAVAATSGYRVIRDSVALPNNQVDDNWANNSSGNVFAAVNTDAVNQLPVSSTFENAAADWVRFGEGDHNPMTLFNMLVGNNDSRGYDNSRGAMGYPNFALPAGEAGFVVLPVSEIPAGQKAMDFYVAYAQQTDEEDKLEIVYSEDCGENWITVWEKSGSELKTVDPVGTQNTFIPAGNSDWRFESIDVSAIPAGQALVAFRATSDGGSYLFLDNVTFRAGEPNGIEALMIADGFHIYPNPVRDNLSLEMTMLKTVHAEVNIFNVLGQQVKNLATTLQAGPNTIMLSTAELATGVYVLNIQTEAGTRQKKFVKE